MNEKDIIIDPIITHNNYLIEVAPDEFVNVTQLWKECKQIVKDKKDLQNRIDKAIEYIKHYETIRGYYEYVENGYDEYNYEEDLKEELLDILKESGE